MSSGRSSLRGRTRGCRSPSGDIYVDQRDRGTFWQVLQFGIQNLYDPELDEWAVMDTFERTPGTVTLPPRCATPA
ncbi:hypothetical protein [Streptomyces cucumeris]|uniref:hypothetical protein n=1 Tax=Streptomyces cucumeris TaxID=2962890 RepID=UPI0020C91D04|nr:hypothetical protein [Streptomyces sp. NEAU-Y11]MCP9210094.1 hypothetical protein [Streptomyces sp. NEAU-Y11]